MALTLTGKIIQNHLVEPRDGIPAPGSDIAIRIDQTLTQDATGTMAYLQFETIGIDRVRTELSVSYIDHNTLQEDFKNMDDHRYLQSIAARYGLWFSRAGNGICHQVHLERFGVPGKTLLGSDSHTPTGGGIGMMAIGAGGLDVAVAMGGGAFHLAMPKVFGVRLSGTLRNGVSAKDVILEVLRLETVKGGVGSVYEYFGPGVSGLSVPQRATITNMGAELGATCSIFPSDDTTLKFLTEMGRPECFTAMAADEGAVYDKVIEIDLSSLAPLAAQPHSPDNIAPVSSLAGKRVTQVAIGSCTNSSLSDLTAVAAIVKGKHIAPWVEAGIAPGSRQTLMQAEQAGVLGELIRAGFRILESACGPCIGMGFAPNSEGVTLRTFNRNFKGRSGTPDASVYLVSPETAAIAAITGFITDPITVADTLSANRPAFSAPKAVCTRDDSMLIAPLAPADAEGTEILRGPNIKPCPASPQMPDALTLPLLLKAGDNVSTDDIMPAGAKVLPLRSNIPEISRFTFERLDTGFYDRAKSGSGCFVLGGENYGQGSSREHAALAPMYLGVRAVLVKSFARIHKANLINYGIVPLVLSNPAVYESLKQDDVLEFYGITSALKDGTPFTLRRASDGLSFSAKNDLDARSRKILLAGGLAAYTRLGGQ
jgi:aconitate hydratase, putative, Aquifex type